jgi:hypothetical protein
MNTKGAKMLFRVYNYLERQMLVWRNDYSDKGMAEYNYYRDAVMFITYMVKGEW